MRNLDRQKPDCGQKVLTMFHLERAATNIRYQYTCCQLKDQVYETQSKTTAFNDDGGTVRDLVFLDRHSVDCGTTGLISAFRVERNFNGDKVFVPFHSFKCVSH